MTNDNDRKELRQRAEKQVGKTAQGASELTREDALHLVHELQVHQIELEIQNEDLNAAREDLARARDRYRDLYDFAPVGYLTMSKHNIIREANITVCQMLGVKREDLLKRRLTDFIAPESQDEFYRRRREILRTGKRQTCELVIRISDGGSFWAALDCARDTDGLRVTVSDISLLKQAEEELRVKDYAIESATSGIVLTDLNSQLTYVNPALLKMWGYAKPNEVLGKDAGRFFSETKKAKEGLKNTLEKGNWQGELEGIRKDGSLFHENVTANLVSDARGKPTHIMASMLDITEQKKVERFKDEFIGMVSHEIKTPLTVIIGALSTANLKELPPEQVKEFIEDALIYSDILNDIVDNLLELSRAQSDRLSLEKALADIREVIGRVVEMLEKRAHNHNLIIDIPENIPRVTVDRTRVERIILNLADNAIKYSPQGGDIRIFIEQRDSGLLVGVSDRGIGISKEDQARLFQRFERLDFHNGGAIQGIGLGLVVCRVLVEAHGGNIWVESKPGKGSTFFFTLPVEQVENSNLNMSENELDLVE